MKRVFDFTVAMIALLLTAPLQVVVGAVVRLKLGPPIFFRQARPGQDGRIFELVKFRTMHSLDAERGLVTDEERLSRVGRVLRSLSLDELPTLWNVLKGDMSLVGPRPLLVKYLPLYTEDQSRRHEVKPGVTGLAQVSGRNALSWERKFELDVLYVDSRSLLLDLQILYRTILKVLRREGIAQKGSATMPEFKGTD